jgi:Ni,Fe-hydrogenase III small subunit/formate hydrogenlyase subunit 6/NADH:ubiquinone oxidoreductase subunit I
VFEIFLERFRQKTRTIAFPASLPSLPPRFRGRPFIDADRCAAAGECGRCAEACPWHAISFENAKPALDTGLCVFCGECARVCPQRAMVFTTDWRLASTDRDALVVRPAAYASPGQPGGQGAGLRASSGLVDDDDERLYVLPELPMTSVTSLAAAFARSFRLRQVTAAGCGACEADLNVLGTVVYDMGRFGIDFVASPRHADGIALTGPAPRNMRAALLDCYAAMPAPKVIIAVGACAISGGMFRRAASPVSDSIQGAPPQCQPALFIPGCPPHPCTTLDAFLRFLDQRTPR